MPASEDGTHDELLGRAGRYARLHQAGHRRKLIEYLESPLLQYRQETGRER